jgi:D-3-phosphoglycerate dehydrogenase
VENTPGQNANAVAELVFGMLVFAVRSFYNGKSGTELIADDEIFVLAIGRYGILTGIKITAFIKNLYG